MNRPIKFRAWAGRHRKMFYGVGILNGVIYLPDDKKLTTTKTLMQFTGLHDKNGKEIYEGDIVRAASEGIWRTVEVRWRQEGNPQWILWPAYHDGKFWYLNGATRQPDGTYKEMCEVIGNIYENSELLENNLHQL